MNRTARRDLYTYDMDYPPPVRQYRYERSPSPPPKQVIHVIRDDEPQETLQRVYYAPRRARSLTPPRRVIRRTESPPVIRYRARSVSPEPRYVVQRPPNRYAFSFQDERPDYVRERAVYPPRQYVYRYDDQSEYSYDFYEDDREDLYRFNEMRAELNERRPPRVVYETYPRREPMERYYIPRAPRIAPEANYADAYLVKDMDLYGKREKIIYETRDDMPAYRHEDVHAQRLGPSLSFYRPRYPRY